MIELNDYPQRIILICFEVSKASLPSLPCLIKELLLHYRNGTI